MRNDGLRLRCVADSGLHGCRGCDGEGKESRKEESNGIMFVCDNCGSTFDLPRAWKEHGEIHIGSPCCLTGYEEAFRCKQCDAVIPEEQNLFHKCAKCEAKTFERFIWLLENEFDDDDRAYINRFCEGADLTEPEKIKPVLAILRG